ncbi:MAG: hypothetical protein LUQ20_02995 [Candidatus Methanoperedens sp.]|nr:hypothetical protein [Candidatus Methanoperedens sp.]
MSTSTVTPVDCVHTYASALAYVDGRPQGAQPLTYALQGIRGCGVENAQGFGMMNADVNTELLRTRYELRLY